MHKMDARLKTVALIWLTLLIGSAGVPGLILLSIGIIALFSLSRLNVRVLKSMAMVLIWLSFFYIVVSGWEWEAGWQIWRGHWSEAGLRQGEMIVWRVLMIFSLTRVFLAVTKPLELGLSIAWFLNPLARIMPKASDGILLITLTLQFIPLLIEEAAQIWKARAAKGNLKTSLFGRGAEMLKLVQPLLLLSLRRAEELAENLLARGYQTGRYRVIGNTSWRKADTAGGIILGIWSIAVMLTIFLPVSFF